MPLYRCPHTTIHVSAYHSMRVLTLLHMCAHRQVRRRHMHAHAGMCPHRQLRICVLTENCTYVSSKRSGQICPHRQVRQRPSKALRLYQDSNGSNGWRRRQPPAVGGEGSRLLTTCMHIEARREASIRVSAYHSMSVLILLCMCRHRTIHVSAYTTTYVFSYHLETAVCL